MGFILDAGPKDAIIDATKSSLDIIRKIKFLYIFQYYKKIIFNYVLCKQNVEGDEDEEK